MRRLVGLAFAWSAVVLAVLLFLPWVGYPEPGCWRLVAQPAGCLEELARANDRIWWTQTVPRLAFFAIGYVIVLALVMRRWRRRA